MSKLPVVSGLECIKALEKIGFAIVRQRDRHILFSTRKCQKHGDCSQS
jgi:predicted RNA binding protein YcfA (HicA-like mRNA interferase family)